MKKIKVINISMHTMTFLHSTPFPKTKRDTLLFGEIQSSSLTLGLFCKICRILMAEFSFVELGT